MSGHIELPIGSPRIKAKIATLSDLADTHLDTLMERARAFKSELPSAFGNSAAIQIVLSESAPMDQAYREMSLCYRRLLLTRCIRNAQRELAAAEPNNRDYRPNFSAADLDTYIGNNRNLFHECVEMIDPPPIDTLERGGHQSDPTQDQPSEITSDASASNST